MRQLIAVTTAAVALALAATAHAATPAARHACRAGYRAHTVRLHRLRRHGRLVRRHGRVVWVTRVRCEAIKVLATPPTSPAPPPSAPRVSYDAGVDPSFTQAPGNPLAVTYAYSADATETDGTTQTNLAAGGQLPAGILDFYSPTSPGGPSSLICSMDVGGDVTGGSCPVTYAATGTYDVTTEYIPNGVSAVTETDSETINPYSTQTTEQLATQGSAITVVPQVLDQAGSPPDQSEVSITVYDTRNGNQGTWSGSGTLTLTEQDPYGPASAYLTGSFSGGGASGSELPVQSGDTLQVTTSYAGDGSYTGSASSTAATTVP